MEEQHDVTGLVFSGERREIHISENITLIVRKPQRNICALVFVECLGRWQVFESFQTYYLFSFRNDAVAAVVKTSNFVTTGVVLLLPPRGECV